MCFNTNHNIKCAVWAVNVRESVETFQKLMSHIQPTFNDAGLAHLSDSAHLRFGHPLMSQIQPTTNDSDLAHL